MDTQLCLLSFFTMVIFLFNTFVLGSKLEQSSSTVVAIKAGQIRGKHVELSFGQAVDQFLGVPYAAAPVGQLRFAPPEDVKPWHGVRDATNYGANCPQNESPWALADGRFILGLQPRDKAAMLVVKTKEIFLLNLHQNRVRFPAERNAFVLDHQHGCCDVTCKPAIKVPPGGGGGGGWGGYLGQFLLGMCHWPLRTRTPFLISQNMYPISCCS